GAATGGGTAGGASGGGGGGTGGGTVTADGGTYGVPNGTYPMWRERTIAVLTNAVRISPSDYKGSSVYSTPYTPAYSSATVLGTLYPATTPLFYDYDLNRSSRQHSEEMADDDYFAHESVDGGDPFVRIKSYYKKSQTLGENIAAGTHGS